MTDKTISTNYLEESNPNMSKEFLEMVSKEAVYHPSFDKLNPSEYVKAPYKPPPEYEKLAHMFLLDVDEKGVWCDTDIPDQAVPGDSVAFSSLYDRMEKDKEEFRKFLVKAAHSSDITLANSAQKYLDDLDELDQDA